MIKLLVISACVCVALASESVGPLEPKPEKFKHQEGCYVSELDEVIPIAESKPSKSSCMEYSCGPLLLTYVRCDTVSTSPPCKVIEEKEKPFPDCCPRSWCPSSTETA